MSRLNLNFKNFLSTKTIPFDDSESKTHHHQCDPIANGHGWSYFADFLLDILVNIY